MTTAINPRSLQIEAHYLTTDVHRLADLKARLVANGETMPIASGLIGWLVDKSAGRRDLTSSSTRARYRKALAELGEPPERDEAPIILDSSVTSSWRRRRAARSTARRVMRQLAAA